MGDERVVPYVADCLVEPSLDSQVRQRVGQQRPQALRGDKLPASGGDVRPVQGCSRVRGADQWRDIAVLETDPAQTGPRSDQVKCDASYPRRVLRGAVLTSM